MRRMPFHFFPQLGAPAPSPQPQPPSPVLHSQEPVSASLWESNRSRDDRPLDVKQGTLALMVLKTLDVMGPLHGYGIARRIEQISGRLLAVNQGTLYPALLKLEQEGDIESEWGASDNNRKPSFYQLTRGRKRVERETREWRADIRDSRVVPGPPQAERSRGPCAEWLFRLAGAIRRSRGARELDEELASTSPAAH